MSTVTRSPNSATATCFHLGRPGSKVSPYKSDQSSTSPRIFKSAFGSPSVLPSPRTQRTMGGTQSCTGKQVSSNPASAVAHSTSTVGGATKQQATVVNSNTTEDGSGDGVKKVERMSKYKEERRRQLALKYADWSSSEDVAHIGEEPSYLRFSQRYRRQIGGEGNAAVKTKNGSSGKPEMSPSPDPGGTPVMELGGLVRTNRASRLRAMTAGGNAQDNLPPPSSEFVRVGSLRSRAPLRESGFTRSSNYRRSFNGSSTQSSWNGRGSMQISSSTETTENGDYSFPLDAIQKTRDKSGKRKSNLNRAMIVEMSQEPSKDDSLPPWRRAKMLDNSAGTVVSEGSTPRSVTRHLADGHAVDWKSGRRIYPGFVASRPTIMSDKPHFHHHHQDESLPNGCETERKENLVKGPFADGDENSEQENAFTVKFEIKEVVNPKDGKWDDDSNTSSADCINELTKLVKATSDRVNTMTHVVLNSEKNSDRCEIGSSVPSTMTTPSYGVIQKTPSGSTKINITAQPLNAEVNHQVNNTKEEVGIINSSDDEEELKRSVECVESTMKKPPLFMSKGNEEIYRQELDNNSANESSVVSILRRRSSSDEGKFSHSILKMKKVSSSQESEDLPPHGILKRQSSGEGGGGGGEQRRPILKKRNSTDDSDSFPKPILKVYKNSGDDDDLSLSEEEVEDDAKNARRSILSKRQPRADEPLASILKTPEAPGSVETTRRPSILKSCSLDMGALVKSDGLDSQDESSLPQPLLPSILKKRSREVHPLATPYTEFANLIKANQGPQETSASKAAAVAAELFSAQDTSSLGERRMSVAERISQMENKLADEAEQTRSTPSRSPWRSGNWTPTSCGSTPPLQGEVNGSGNGLCNAEVLSRLEDLSASHRRVRDRFSSRYRTQPITLGEVVETNRSPSVRVFQRRLEASLAECQKDESVTAATTKIHATSPPKSTPTICNDAKETVLENGEQQHVKQPSTRAAPTAFDVRVETVTTTSESNASCYSLQRCSTQPVTFTEFHDIKKRTIDGNDHSQTNGSSDDSEEDPCKLSLADRVRFFDRKVMEEKFSSGITKSASSTRVRRESSRYKTQPITLSEVEKAQLLQTTGDAPSSLLTNGVSAPSAKDSCSPPPSQPFVVHDRPKVHSPTPCHRAVMSSNDDDSSGSGFHDSAKRKIIKNEAVNRRRNAALRRKDDRLSMCEIPTAMEGSGLDRPRSAVVHQRSITQPLTKLEVEKADSNGSMKMSIAERLALLQKSGEEGWRHRVPKNPDNLLTLASDGEKKVEKPVEETSLSLQSVREKRRPRDERPSSIVDRICQLEVSQVGWKQRVEEKDASQFTVAGRMGCADQETVDGSERRRQVPTACVFTSKVAECESDREKGQTAFASPMQKSASMPSCHLLNSIQSRDDDDTGVVSSHIIVPKADDESFQEFFKSIHENDKTWGQQQVVEISESEFDQVTTTSNQMLIQKRSVMRQRRTAVSSRNPVKALAQRTDIQNGYTEVKTGIAEKELRKLKTDQLSKTTNLAVSALAGLASKEDFTAVALKKTSSSAAGPFLPFKDVMLLQVKGRRHVQTRLVEPCVSSVNRGDTYILVTPHQVFIWIGRFSNVIERSRGTEVTTAVQNTKDLGYLSCAPAVIIDEEKDSGSEFEKRFCHLLNGDTIDISDAGKPHEDEVYENAIVETNMVYEVDERRGQLVPHSECWGTIPKIDLLESNKVLVFDFGSELYLWQGKLAPTALRKTGLLLAKELWDNGYDYSECAIDPLHPEVLGSDGEREKRRQKRPPWALLAKVNQHMETVLFREKFLDWPDSTRIIKVKTPDCEEKSKPLTPLVPCDANQMLETSPGEPDLVLEGSHLGRGSSYWDGDNRRLHEITTLGIKVWHIAEMSYRLLPRESWGQFHSGDTYVVRWQYMITVTGRDLSGKMSRHSFVGRERCAYFFWQGVDSTINEKGASALLTVELDEERGPHVRVDEGREPACFLSMFDGTMIVHKGKRMIRQNSISSEDSEEEKEEIAQPEPICRWRLFIVRGEVESEGHLVQVEADPTSLRSRGCFILVDTREGVLYLWYGGKSKEHVQQIALATAENIRDRRPLEMSFECHMPLELVEMHEGSELSEFTNGIGLIKGCYDILYESPLNYDFTPRLFYLSSTSGSFTASEVACQFRCNQAVCAFPLLQRDLYESDQPALFLLDNEYQVFLWQGWWPEATDDDNNTATGSAKVRWNVDRRCAMQTVLAYCSKKNVTKPPTAYVVSAGLEPLCFTNLFPEWKQRDDVALLNCMDGKQDGEQPLVGEVLSSLMRNRYTLSELQESPLPAGVDPSHIESYLDDDMFEVALGMTTKEFYSLPAWRQTEVKKLNGLF